MNHEETLLLDIINRVTEWEEVPLQTRRDFLAHIIEINTLDEKAVTFIQQTLDRFKAEQILSIKVLKQDLAQYEGYLAAQKEPATNWKHQLVQGAIDKMNAFTDSFKEGFRGAESRWNQADESAEETANMAAVAALKGSL